MLKKDVVFVVVVKTNSGVHPVRERNKMIGSLIFRFIQI